MRNFLSRIVPLFFILSLFFRPFLSPVTAMVEYWSTDVDLGAVDASFQGESANDLSGYTLAEVGDVNGDGFDDFLIGAQWNSQVGASSGKVYLFFGGESGWSMDMNLANADASFLGEAAGDEAGCSISAAGDVNGDDLDDFLIGAEGNDEFAGGAGQVYLIFGKASGWSLDVSLSNADASFQGENAGDAAGIGVAGGVNLNNDEYDDFIIGADHYVVGINTVGINYIIFGSDSGWAQDTSLSVATASYVGEPASGGPIGEEITGAGDVNGDNFDDFVTSCSNNAEHGIGTGQAYLIFGKSSGWTTEASVATADASFYGEAVSDFLGKEVDGGGDINNDGYDDFLLLADGSDDGGNYAGEVYIIYGADGGWSMDTDISGASSSFVGENADDCESYARVRIAGDVNLDGYDDILISMPAWESGMWQGKAYLVLGRSEVWGTDVSLGVAADASYIGESADDWDTAGEGLSSAGDVNGDGFDDFLIGSPYNCESASSAGQTYLVFGGEDLYQALVIPSLNVVTGADLNIEVGTLNGVFGTNSVFITDESSYLISQVSAYFDEDLDWSSVSGGIDLAQGKSFIHGLSGAPGVISHSLYVPKSASDNALGYCPSATSLDDVYVGCPDYEQFEEGDLGITIVTAGGQDYWLIPSGALGSGGISLEIDEETAETGMAMQSGMIFGSSLILLLMFIKLCNVKSKRLSFK